MASANVERLRQAYDAYDREGIGAVLVYLDPDVEWRNPADSPIAGVFAVHEGVVEWQRAVDEAFEEMHFEPQRIAALTMYASEAAALQAAGLAR